MTNSNSLLILDWDSSDALVTYKNSPLGRAVAQAAFDAAQKSGYYAYMVTKTAVQGEVIQEFDPSVERIIMVPSYEGDAGALRTNTLGGTP